MTKLGLVAHLVRLAVSSAAGLMAVAVVIGGNDSEMGTGILTLSTTAFVFVGLMSSHRTPWHYIGTGAGAVCACAAGWSWLNNVEDAGGSLTETLNYMGIVVGAALLFGLLVVVICWAVWIAWRDRRRSTSD